MTVLREYHAAIGELVLQFEGTLERFVGDGVLVLFNDPLPQQDHSERAVRLALHMRERVHVLAEGWRKRGHDLGFGVGVARGYATLGSVGFEHRQEYSVIGTVPNLACRLCGDAKPGQILLSQKVVASVYGRIEVSPVGDLTLKGFHKPVPAFELVSWCGSCDESRHEAAGERARARRRPLRKPRRLPLLAHRCAVIEEYAHETRTIAVEGTSQLTSARSCASRRFELADPRSTGGGTP